MADRNGVKKAVVTGGAGFIGSHIADECVKRGWQVTILDNLSSGSMDNIRHLLGNNCSQFKVDSAHSGKSELAADCKLSTDSCKLFPVNFVKGSITDLPLLQSLFQDVDYIFHQAAIASVQSSINDPQTSHEINVTGSLNVLLAARDNQVKKVVCASSAAVYGNDGTLPKKEDMPPDPQSPYAVHKLAMEYYCRVFNSLYHLPTVCLRYFNVYGSRQNPSSEYAAVIPKFIQKIDQGESPVIYGDGLQTRDFVSVQDVAEANLLFAQNDATGTYNIGSGEQTSLNHLAEILIMLTGRTELKVKYENPRAGDITHSLADISKAKSTGYVPHYTLAEGLRQLVGIKAIQNAPQPITPTFCKQ